MSAMQLNGGRPRKPTAIKRAQGTARADRLNALEPIVAPMLIGAAPDRLPALVRMVWDTLAPEVNALRVASTGDLFAFERMCFAAAASIEAYQNPDAKIGERVAADKNLLIWLSMFGLTPSTRSKVSAIGSAPGSDPLDEFAAN